MKNIFAVDKPKGMTSHDVVQIVRRATGIKRVGHGGTLDPLATGVLVIAVGRENTKQLEKYVKGEKEYIATIKLGYISTTDDGEGEITENIIEHIPSSNNIKYTVKSFIGNIHQIPPMHSAIRVNGQRAYKIARRDNPDKITLEPRGVEIKNIEILSYEYPILKIKVVCGPGTYIRSLARDIGEKLGTGAYLSDLVRSKVGEFTIENTKSIEEFKNVKLE